MIAEKGSLKRKNNIITPTERRMSYDTDET